MPAKTKPTTSAKKKAGPKSKPASAAASLTLTLEEARGLLIAAQGLSRPAGDDITEVLERTGFVRTIGGIEAYLALRARVPGLTAKRVHAALEAAEARITPAARGCMYVVARAHAADAMRLAESLSAPRHARDVEKAGIRKGEVETLAALVAGALAEKGPLTTDAIRKALPEGSLRSLGEQGKKVGVSSPLPLALRALEFGGRIERATEGGRLDTERYLWRVREKGGKGGKGAAKGEAGLKGGAAGDPLPRVAEIYLRAAGLGTLAELSAWAGVSQREARAALEALPVATVAIEGDPTPRLMLEESRALLEDRGLQDAARDAVALLPFEDNLLALQGSAGLLVDAAHRDVRVPTWGMGGKEEPLGSARHGSQRTILAEGRIAGFWEYDPDARAVVTGLLGPVARATQGRIAKEAAALGAFIRDELGGNGRSFSLDTEDELRERCKWVKGLKTK